MPKKSRKSCKSQLVVIEPLIREIRGQKVILDADLARVYGVTTSAFNQAVKRNRPRFPKDFIFKIRAAEWRDVNLSQIVTGSQRHRDVKKLPYAFTEHGAIMAATILNSPQAVQMSVLVVRAFVRMKKMVASADGLAKELAALKKELRSRLDIHETAIKDILKRIMMILSPPEPPPAPPKRPIGFYGRD